MSREFVFIFDFVLVFSIVGMWKTFKKAGRSGWEALVPFYGIVIQCEISGINPYWLIVVVVTSMFSFLLPFIGLLLAIFFAIYFVVILSISTARSFGKEDIFGIGLLLLGAVFWPLLGFSDAEYKGPTPVNDEIWALLAETFGKKKNNNNNTSNQQSMKSCRTCGTMVKMDAKFCPNCGNRVD